MSSQPKELMELLFPVTLATGLPFMSTTVGGVGGGDTGSTVGLLVGRLVGKLVGCFEGAAVEGSGVGRDVGIAVVGGEEGCE